MSAEQCWRNKAFADRRCKKIGTWQSPPHLCVGQSASFMRALRWCDEHRHETDVPVDDEPKPRSEESA